MTNAKRIEILRKKYEKARSHADAAMEERDFARRQLNYAELGYDDRGKPLRKSNRR